MLTEEGRQSMADLWFKIKADTSELDKAYKRLSEVEKLIASFNKKLSEVEPGGKKFKEISNQLTTLEKDYDKAIKKIADLENSLQSMAEAKNVVSQTKEITDSANEATKVFVKYAGSLDELDRRVKDLTKEYLSMNATQKASIQGQSIINEIAILNSQRKIEADSLRALQKEYVNTQKMQDLQEGSIVALRAELSKLTASYDGMGRSMRSGATGKELLGSIRNVTQELNEAEQASMRFNRNVGNYASGWNGLNVQVQQVARELPSLAIGANTFFLAISNNLPMLADELKRAKTEYKAFVAEGKAATPVWKQVLSSLFSWQTALVAGITILSVYGKEIISWVGSLFTAKKALSETYQSLEDYQKKVGETSGSVIAQLEKLSAGWKRLGSDIKAQEKFIRDNKEAFDSTGLAINSIVDAENLLVQNKAAFIISILEKAKAAAAMELAAEEYKKAVQKMTEAETMPDKKTYKHWTGTLFHGYWETRSYDNPDKKKAEKEAEEYKQSMLDIIQKVIGHDDKFAELVKKAGFDFTSTIVEGSVEAIEAAISIKQQSLKKVTDPKEYKRIEAQIKAEKAKLRAITGEKEKSNIKNYIDSYQQEKEIKKAAQSIKDTLAESDLDIRQQQLDLDKEGSKKQLAQIRLNYDKRYQEILKEERDLLQKLQNEERKQWEKDNPKFKEKNLQFTPTITSLTPEQRAQHDKEYSLAYQRQEKDTQALLDKLLEKYRDFDAQRTAIEKDGNTEIAYLQEQRTDANANEIDRAIAVAKQKMKEGVQAITDTEASKTSEDNPFLKNLFGDTSQMAFKDLQNLIEQAKQVQSYLSGNGDSSGITFISPEQLKTITESPDELDKLKKALDKLLKGEKGNEWDDIFEGFTKGLAKVKSAKGFKEFSEGMQNIGDSASKASTMIGGVAGNLSSMFEEMGNTGAADAMSGVQDAMNAISNIGQGFAKGGIVGGIAAAVGEAANFIGKAFAANARHKAALKEIMNETIAQQREYNLLLMQQNLEYEKAATIFGTDVYGKAANAVRVMKEAVADLKEELAGTTEQKKNQSKDALFKNFFGVSNPQAELKKAYAGLADIEIKTGHKKTGLFGWGKGKDIYSSILDVHPELIKANGEFDASLAEIILNTKTMSDESKKSLQNMIDLANQAKEAYEAINDYFTDIFGELGNTMSDALVDAFINGTDAAQAFTDSVSNMLETLAKQMIYSVTLAPMMEKAQKEMMDVMQNVGLSDEQKFSKWTGILDGLVDDAVNQQGLANRLLEEYQQAAKDKGFDIFQPDKSTSQNSTKGAFESMSQDTGNELNGRFTALQIAGEEIKNQAAEQTSLLSSINEKMSALCTMPETGSSTNIINSVPSSDGLREMLVANLAQKDSSSGQIVEQLVSMKGEVMNIRNTIDQMEKKQAEWTMNFEITAENSTVLAKNSPKMLANSEEVKRNTAALGRR